METQVSRTEYGPHRPPEARLALDDDRNVSATINLLGGVAADGAGMAKKSALKLRDHGVPDLESLLALARQKSKAGRKNLFTTVKDLFFESEGELSDRERALMGDILRKLVHDVEREMRQEISERLAERTDAPHDLVVELANDDIEVAHPVLMKSSVLQDIDLIEIVRHRTQAHQVTIAIRKDVSEDVSRALVDTGDPDVIATLLKNDDAAISRSLMEYLVAESKRVDTFQNPLVNRRDLPPDLARKMYWWVSAALRKHIVENCDVDATAIDDAIEDTVNETLAREDREDAPLSEAEMFAQQMAERGKITEDFLLQTLRQGEISLFEACFANYVDLRLRLVRRLLYEPGGEGLSMACKAAGFKRGTFATIFQLTREGRASKQPFDPNEVSRVSEFYDRLHHDHAVTIITRWRRDTDYLNALNEIEETSG